MMYQEFVCKKCGHVSYYIEAAKSHQEEKHPKAIPKKTVIKQIWFAWHPVVTEQNRIAWLRKIVRVWDESMYSHGDFSGHSFDVGGWKYYG